jgi:hypothetical protein
METLHIQYGVLFTSRAFKIPFSLPHDINLVTNDNLPKHGAYNQNTQWIVVAGWECQDLSLAGQGKGLAGPQSSTFYPLIELCATLQLLQPTHPPAFLFENTAMQTHKDPNISVRDFDVISPLSASPCCLTQLALESARTGYAISGPNWRCHIALHTAQNISTGAQTSSQICGWIQAENYQRRVLQLSPFLPLQ